MGGFEEFCSRDNSLIWDTDLLLNNSYPKFTECFQNTLLVWVPCGFLWILAPIYIYVLVNGNGTPKPLSGLNMSKMFFSLVLFMLVVVDLVREASADDRDTLPKAVYVASSIKAASILLTTLLLFLERRQGYITSGVLFLFYLFMVIAGIIPFYTLIKEEVYDGKMFKFIMFYIYYGVLLVEFILLCFSEAPSQGERHGYEPIGRTACPEAVASFPNRLSFWWLNGLVRTGYKKDLSDEDIFDLNPRDKSEVVVPELEEKWAPEVEKSKRYHRQQSAAVKFTSPKRAHLQDNSEKTPLLKQKNVPAVEIKGNKDKEEKDNNPASLFKAICKAFGGSFLKAWGCKFIYDIMQFVSPTLLGVLINYVNDKDDMPDNQVWKGYVYSAAFFIVAFIGSVMFHQNFHLGMTAGMRIRTALIAAVYKKALTMNNEAKKLSTVGEIVNLMSVDCQRMQDLAGYLWMVWSSPVQIVIAMWLLWLQLGPSVLAGLGVMVLLIPLNAYISIKQRNLQVALMRFKDSRLKLMNEVLNGMKVLKLYAWEPSFQEKVNEIRNKELDVLRKFAYLQAFSTFSFTCAPFLVTLASFATFILSSAENHLTADKAFVSLSLFNILRFPINLLPMMISYLIQAQVSIKRLRKFLLNGDLDANNVSHDPNTSDAIRIKNGTFSWDEELQPALRDINVTIPQGKLVAVVGTVGCGKSSLVSAILGEMEKLKGSVNVKGSIAYVPQQAWIQNATVKDNILFGKELNTCVYEDVIEACALQPDLEILTAGDMTEIGEKGINLSGGQKQRVSLARAVYNNADIYLLDDPLSAVDSHVGKHIFEKVVGSKGILRNKTRVLVTHGVHWLPMVDTIIVLVDGQITETGSYEDLMSHDGTFAQFLKTYLTSKEAEEEEEEEDFDPEIQQMRSKILERVESVTSDTATSGDEARIRRRKSSTSSATTKKTPKISRSISTMGKDPCVAPEKKEERKKDVLIQEEKEEKGKVKTVVFLQYLRAIGLVATFFIFAIFAAYQAASIMANIWLSMWTDDKYLLNVTNQDTDEYRNKNYTYLGVYAALGIGQAFIILVYSILASLKQVNAAGRLHLNMLTNIMKAPMAFFDTTPVGRIVNRFSRDIETIDSLLPGTFRMWINISFSTLATLIVICYSTPIFLSVIVPIGIIYYLIQRFYIPTSRQLQRIESTSRSPIFTHFSETISGASTIRAYGQQDRFIEESLRRVDKNVLFYFARIASNRWLGTRLEFIGNLVVFAAAMFAVVSDIEGGLVGLSVSYALQITSALNMLVRTTSDLETHVVSVERVKEYGEIETEADWVQPFRRPPREWPQDGQVQFQDYKTRYRPGLDLVIRGITCDIIGGQKVGIVGRTGAGKSSLTVALFRLIEAAGGSITIDGRRISDMGLHDLRNKLTILPQDPVLFSGTLRMNLDPFDAYSDNQLWTAIEHAHLKKFVSELPDGLQHQCGEGGQNLSVGQRQLVCLARTLLRKTKILILDEATAAVDMETDELIQKTIRNEFKDCTVLTIAHRLNTIMDYDMVMVLDQGLIKEFDSPTNLLKDKKSTFYGMAKDANLV